MKKIVSLLIFAVALMSSGTALADADGHCNYTHESAYSDVPFKLCQTPTSAEDCESLGNSDGNADAAHGDGACAVEGAVGTCDMGEEKLVYYNGDAEGLEIGCDFQSGEWVTAE